MSDPPASMSDLSSSLSALQARFAQMRSQNAAMQVTAQLQSQQLQQVTNPNTSNPTDNLDPLSSSIPTVSTSLTASSSDPPAPFLPVHLSSPVSSPLISALSAESIDHIERIEAIEHIGSIDNIDNRDDTDDRNTLLTISPPRSKKKDKLKPMLRSERMAAEGKKETVKALGAPTIKPPEKTNRLSSPPSVSSSKPPVSSPPNSADKAKQPQKSPPSASSSSVRSLRQPVRSPPNHSRHSSSGSASKQPVHSPQSANSARQSSSARTPNSSSSARTPVSASARSTTPLSSSRTPTTSSQHRRQTSAEKNTSASLSPRPLSAPGTRPNSARRTTPTGMLSSGEKKKSVNSAANTTGTTPTGQMKKRASDGSAEKGSLARKSLKQTSAEKPAKSIISKSSPNASSMPTPQLILKPSSAHASRPSQSFSSLPLSSVIDPLNDEPSVSVDELSESMRSQAIRAAFEALNDLTLTDALAFDQGEDELSLPPAAIAVSEPSPVLPSASSPDLSPSFSALPDSSVSSNWSSSMPSLSDLNRVTVNISQPVSSSAPAILSPISITSAGSELSPVREREEKEMDHEREKQKTPTTLLYSAREMSDQNSARRWSGGAANGSGSGNSGERKRVKTSRTMSVIDARASLPSRSSTSSNRLSAGRQSVSGSLRPDASPGRKSPRLLPLSPSSSRLHSLSNTLSNTLSSTTSSMDAIHSHHSHRRLRSMSVLDPALGSRKTSDNSARGGGMDPAWAAALAMANAHTPKQSDNQPLQVYVRVRPIIEEEQEGGIYLPNDNRSIIVESHEKTISFAFDHVFGPNSTQQDVYERVCTKVLDDVISGYNGTIMAYGQTSTGKTYTMTGPQGDLSDDPRTTRGVIPRLADALFTYFSQQSQSTNTTIECSYFEIYKGKIRDLWSEYSGSELRATGVETMKEVDDVGLMMSPHSSSTLTTPAHGLSSSSSHSFSFPNSSPQSSPSPTPHSSEHTTKISLKESRDKTSVQVVGVRRFTMSDARTLLKAWKEGNKKRITAKTNANWFSSRGHAILDIHIIQHNKQTNEQIKSKLRLVDLAGSEQAESTGIDAARLEEAKVINRSLSCLAKVINSLSSRHSHVSYRDSTLTRVLRESLGGNSRCALILTCSPAAVHLRKTTNTLRFGSQANTIITSAYTNRSFSLSSTVPTPLNRSLKVPLDGLFSEQMRQLSDEKEEKYKEEIAQINKKYREVEEQ